MQRFEEKVAFVTGAASGIGRATAERLAREGASLYLVDLSEEGLAETVETCEGHGAKVASSLCDVSDESQVQAAIDACVAAFGRIDTLVNVAGILCLEHADQLDLERWNKVLAVNLTGTFLCCRAAIPHLLESGGSIVNMSSTSALAGMPYGAVYGASKAGVLAFTKTLAVEYGKKGLRANAICPGSIKTPMGSRSNLPENMDFELLKRAMPLDKPRGPEVIAGVVAMLASEDGAHINGESILVDGGTLA